MSGDRAADLAVLDGALLDLRRLVDTPGPALRHGQQQIEVSTMLVVDAIARSPATECSVGDIAGALHVAHSTASRLVDRAARAGMVDRSRAGSDARRTRLVLTPSGKHLQREAVRFRTGRLAAILGDWTDADAATLTHLLARFAADVHRTQTEGEAR